MTSEAAPAGNSTRQRLLDSALTLFANQGYEGTSVREIIESAGVTRPVLYYYFENKEDLFRELVGSLYEGGHLSIRRAIAAADGTRNKLSAIIRTSFAGCAADPRIPRLLFQTYYGPAVGSLQRVVQSYSTERFLIVHEVIEQGVRNEDLAGGDAGALTLAFCCLMDQHLNVLSQMPHPARRLTPELGDGLVDLFMNGAGTTARRPVNLPDSLS